MWPATSRRSWAEADNSLQPHVNRQSPVNGLLTRRAVHHPSSRDALPRPDAEFSRAGYSAAENRVDRRVHAAGPGRSLHRTGSDTIVPSPEVSARPAHADSCPCPPYSLRHHTRAVTERYCRNLYERVRCRNETVGVQPTRFVTPAAGSRARRRSLECARLDYPRAHAHEAPTYASRQTELRIPKWTRALCKGWPRRCHRSA